MDQGDPVTHAQGRSWVKVLGGCWGETVRGSGMDDTGQELSSCFCYLDVSRVLSLLIIVTDRRLFRGLREATS
jgi:hypothetical protein